MGHHMGRMAYRIAGVRVDDQPNTVKPPKAPMKKSKRMALHMIPPAAAILVIGNGLAALPEHGMHWQAVVLVNTLIVALAWFVVRAVMFLATSMES